MPIHSLSRCFHALEGCLGVTFFRSGEHGYVLSFWKDKPSIEGLEHSEVYQQTVQAIIAAGFLAEPQTVELVELTGGFLTEDALALFSRLKI